MNNYSPQEQKNLIIEKQNAPPKESSKENLKELLQQVIDLKVQLDVMELEIEKIKRQEAAALQSQEIQTQAVPEPVANSGEVAKKKASEKKKFDKGTIVKEVLFYMLLLVLVVGAFFIRSNADGRPILLAGYSAFVVETGSMQAEIPKGSLVITKHVDPKTLKVGDDITFMANQTTTVTHRIIKITENYKGTGQRAFQTQGIMNKSPDKNLVPEANVVGKVIFHSEIVGLISSFVSNNWPILIFGIVIIAGLFFVLERILQSEEDEKPKKQKKEKQKKTPGKLKKTG